MQPDATIGPGTTVEGLETQRLKGALEARLFGAESEPITIGRFEIVARLGQGATRTVYRARDPVSGPRGMSKQPSKRFDSIDALRSALQGGRRRTGRWIAIGLGDANADDPANGGCGEFPWSALSPG